MSRRLFVLLLAILSFQFSISYAQETYLYAQRDTALHLDIYRPTSEPNPYTVVHVFGGGFVRGSRNRQWDADYCRFLAAHGYTAVAIDYRLGLRGAKGAGLGNIPVLERAFYMAAEDCAAAIRYLVDHAAELHIDPSRIILEGGSAGAITVLMTDYARCNSLPCAADLPQDWKPAGVVAYSGAIYSTSGALKWAKEPAPTLLFHGAQDKIVPYRQITLLPRGLYGTSAIVKRMDKFDYPYCVYRYQELGHEVSVGAMHTIDEFNLFVDQYITAGRRLYHDATMRDAAIPPSSYTHLTLRDLYTPRVQQSDRKE